MSLVAIAISGDLASASPMGVGKVKTRYLFSMTGSGRIVDGEGLPTTWQAMPPAAAPSSKPTPVRRRRLGRRRVAVGHTIMPIMAIISRSSTSVKRF